MKAQDQESVPSVLMKYSSLNNTALLLNIQAPSWAQAQMKLKDPFFSMWKAHKKTRMVKMKKTFKGLKSTSQAYKKGKEWKGKSEKDGHFLSFLSCQIIYCKVKSKKN